jgi:predicted DNA binding protein
MRILKIKVPSKILLDLGFPDYFTVVDHIEVLQIYQYDRNNFFSMHAIRFKPDMKGNIAQQLQELFHAQSFQVLEEKRDEILCIMKQRKDSGFWPAFLSGSWALLPPLIIDPDSIMFSIIAKEDEHLASILNQLKIFKSIELLAISKPGDTIETAGQPPPRLTARQREIMTYASRYGYFDLPKKIATKQIASHFGLTPGAVINHVRKAEKLLMRYFFG